MITIKKEGTYIVSGTLKGQLAIKLKSKSKKKYNITLVLKGVDIYCGVAPGVIFYKAYEMDNTNYEDKGIKIEFSKAIELNPDEAGVKIIIADDSDNTVSGSHVAEFYDYVKKDDGTITMLPEDYIEENYNGVIIEGAKFDGAFYSRVSMSIYGEKKGNGILNIIGDNEGLDSEKHLIILGGNINIASQDDGINTNNDGGSVVLIKGGNVKINGGLDAGDGIDSNGYLIIQNGTVISAGSKTKYGLNADLGVSIKGGIVKGVGSIQPWEDKESNQQILHLRFSSEIPKTRKLYVKDSSGKIIISFNPSASRFIPGTEARGYMGAIISHPSLELNKVYYLYLGNIPLHARPSSDRYREETPRLISSVESIPTELNLISKISTFDVYYVNNVNTESSSSKVCFSFINWFAFLIILF